MVVVLANSAVSDWFRIVHSMVNRLERAKVREDGLEIVIAHVPEKPPRHGGINLSCADHSRMHDLQKQGVVVVADAGRVRRQIRAAHHCKRAVGQIATREFKPRKRHALLISKRMAPLTRANLH